jgi:hypothetical protein
MDILKYMSSLHTVRTLALFLRAAVLFAKPLFFFLMCQPSRAQGALSRDINEQSSFFVPSSS